LTAAVVKDDYTGMAELALAVRSLYIDERAHLPVVRY